MLQQKMRIHAQYIKDLSFENPNLPFLGSDNSPDINVTVRRNAVKLELEKGKEKVDKKELFHEVTLHIEIKANLKPIKEEERVGFICDVKYCGIISIDDSLNYSEEEVKQILLIHTPAFLFPFAREIIARVTSSGGVLTIMLDPIDFHIMYNAQERE